MAGTSRRELSDFYEGELSGVIASNWGEDVMVTCDDKLHMSEQTTIQTVQGPINFTKSGSMHTFASPLKVTGAGMNTFAGPFNATSTGINTFAGPFNATSTAINTFAGPLNATNVNSHTFGGPVNFNSSIITPNSNNLSSLDTVEVTQLLAIGAATISGTQWGYLGGMDQDVKQASNVTFNNLVLNGTITTPNSNNLASLDTVEVTQLLNIGSSSITAGEWGYLAAMDQGVASGDTVSFNVIRSDTITSKTTTNHRILMDAGDDQIHIYPGDDPADHHFVLWSNGSAYADLKFYPTEDQMGYIGAATYEWYAMYSLKVFRNGTELDAYDDLSIIEGVTTMKDSKGKPVLNDHGNPYIDPESLPDFLRPNIEDRVPEKAHVELGAWTDLAIGGVKQLYREYKTFRDQALQTIEELRTRITVLEAS